jgi:hypothetical protein
MSEDKIVDGEVVGGARTPDPKPRKSFFHPFAGALILGVDWLAFGMEFFTGFTAVAVASVISFIVTFYGVILIQRQLHGDKPGPATVKAVLGALAAAVPFPIAGTLVGALILGLSGLPTGPAKR